MRPDIDQWELTKHLANRDSRMGDVAELLESMHGPVKPQELSEKHSIERESVYELIEPLEPWAIEQDDDCQLQITSAGEIIRRVYNEATETIDADNIKWLSWSENRGKLLNRLREAGPISPEQLAEKGNTPPKRTIRRNFNGFEDRGWISRGENDQEAHLKIKGEEDSRAYNKLLSESEQIIHKAPCLRDLGLECSNLPVNALSDAEIVEATAENPLRIENRIGELSNRDFERFRALQSHWNSDNAEAFQSHIKAGKQFETVSRPLDYDDLPKDVKGVKAVIQGLKADNQRWLMASEELPCSIAILDTDYIAVGPRDPASGNQTRTGALFSDNDDLVKWGLSLYKDHREQAADPFEISMGFNIGVEELLTLLRQRLGDNDTKSG